MWATSNERTWQDETETPTVPYDKLIPSFAQQTDENHPYRKSAWNDKMWATSNERTWQDETEAPSVPYDKLIPSFAQKKGLDDKNRSWVDGERNYRNYAWTDDQHSNSNEGTWQEETNHPTGYQKSLGGFAQKTANTTAQTYPSKDSHSEILPYDQREHAWNHDQHDQSNEQTWHHETHHPSGYQVTPSFSQKETYPSKDSHSEILPYNQREHSWNIDEYD